MGRGRKKGRKEQGKVKIALLHLLNALDTKEGRKIRKNRHNEMGRDMLIHINTLL